MVPLLFACSALLLGLAPEAEARTPTAEDREAYRAASRQAGRDADAQVKLALWCEARGLSAERLKHLSLAVLADPTHATARGLLGMIADAGGWRKPEAVAARVRSDADLAAALAEYNAKRDKVANTADAQWKLGLWCDANGLKAEATAHYATVIRLDPKRDAAWRKLGYKKVKNRWTTDEQAAAEKAEVEARQAANKRWKPLLEKWKGQLADKAHRDEAEAALSGVTDPRAVPAVLRVFGASDQLRTAQLLGQIDAPDASRALAMLAVFGNTDAVRNAAAQTLRRRDPRDFAELLIELMRDPIKYEVRPVGGPGSPGVLFVEGEEFNVRRSYTPPSAPAIALMPGDVIVPDQFGLPSILRRIEFSYSSMVPIFGFDATYGASVRRQETVSTVTGQFQGKGLPEDGALLAQRLANSFDSPISRQYEADVATARATEKMPTGGPRDFMLNTYSGEEIYRIPVGQMVIEAQKAAVSSRQQLLNDVAMYERTNSAIRHRNARITSVLSSILGEPPGSGRDAWRKWWNGREGYTFKVTEKKPRITLEEVVESSYQPAQIPTDLVDFSRAELTSYRRGHSCFAAGTFVRTLAGPRPIETLRIGDLVLSQDTKTGALSYQPVMVIHHNPPDETLRIDLDGGPVVATPIHRFWLAGKGWAMARDLKVGDEVRVVGGSARVRNVEEDQTQPVFNLEVARGHDFFVGGLGALVHDNSLVQPTPEPFDAPTTATPSAR